MNKKMLIFLLFTLLIFLSLINCGNDGTKVLKERKIITEFYYKKWDFNKDEGSTRISPMDIQDKESLWYVKTDIQGNRIMKGFLCKGKRQDFWTYYDRKGNISKIEFYDDGKITQTINYDR